MPRMQCSSLICSSETSVLKIVERENVFLRGSIKLQCSVSQAIDLARVAGYSLYWEWQQLGVRYFKLVHSTQAKHKMLLWVRQLYKMGEVEILVVVSNPVESHLTNHSCLQEIHALLLAMKLQASRRGMLKQEQNFERGENADCIILKNRLNNPGVCDNN